MQPEFINEWLSRQKPESDRPIAKKYISGVKLRKLFENPEKPLSLKTVMIDGSPVLEEIDRKERISYLDASE